MRLLLDTHIFLWYISGDSNLPVAYRDLIRDSDNNVFLSVVSVWESIIKYNLGKLPLASPPADYLMQQRELHQIQSLPVTEEVLFQLAKLPLLHRDPFDRMMIAQALHHGLTLVTLDNAIKAYPIPFI
ncbi:MAG: type II toxin-antitoxin system VapC family toxin [bacterium]